MLMFNISIDSRYAIAMIFSTLLLLSYPPPSSYTLLPIPSSIFLIFLPPPPPSHPNQGCKQKFVFFLWGAWHPSGQKNYFRGATPHIPPPTVRLGPQSICNKNPSIWEEGGGEDLTLIFPGRGGHHIIL